MRQARVPGWWKVAGGAGRPILYHPDAMHELVHGEGGGAARLRSDPRPDHGRRPISLICLVSLRLACRGRDIHSEEELSPLLSMLPLPGPDISVRGKRERKRIGAECFRRKARAHHTQHAKQESEYGSTRSSKIAVYR